MAAPISQARYDVVENILQKGKATMKIDYQS